ncbi:hypothetical protein BT96DRAFT_971332 [Gymnopus androsaceus JB14]|uniref:Uncharacterized protein n=1 Tax=Gymnopus androsaceus JB14 TaxID=1447944 RepID=A0A6A4IEX2_9AGAR|nr:hypothetical protein BT96DRAFT_971332 [Gymnopus androsaceus JB14]
MDSNSLTSRYDAAYTGTSALRIDSKPDSEKVQRTDLNCWEILQLDPRGGTPCFANKYLIPEYASYDPPRGYTAEEIMQFRGARDNFESVEEIRELILRCGMRWVRWRGRSKVRLARQLSNRYHDNWTGLIVWPYNCKTDSQEFE